ncbi:hypothetical protein TNCV_3192531 [Trichonephila clavipes]|nr:hypothetical protein TNCV_3192531 [Trichonephila clavipes]
MEGDSRRGVLVISAVSEKIKSKFVQADEKLVCYWSSGVATLGLLETDHVAFNHDQVTRSTHELAPPSPNYDTTPMAGRLSSRQI